MPMIWAAALMATATVGSSLIGSSATGKAADATAASSAAAIAEQRRQFDIGQANQQPWLVTGTSALNKLGAMYGLDTYQPNWSATGGAGVSQTPGMQAALAYNPQSEGGGILPDTGLLGMSLLPSIFGTDNRSPLGDIWGALQAGQPVSDESWASAGYGPGGAALNGSTPNLGVVQQPVGGTTNQPNVSSGAATGAQSPGTYTPGSQQPGVDPYADFYKSPDYLFRMTEGLKGVDAGAAAGGSLDSGATRKAEITYAGNLAAGEFNNYANRLALLAGVGQTTATNMAGQGATYAGNVGQIAMNQGNNLASSYLAQGQNYGNTINNLAGIGSGLIMNNPQWFPGGGGAASYNTSTGNWTPGPQGF